MSTQNVRSGRIGPGRGYSWRVPTRIERERRRLGLTQAQVAILCGLTERGYRRIEKGEVVPHGRNARKLAKILGVSLADLGLDKP